MKVKVIISEAPPRSSLTEGPRKEAERDHGQRSEGVRAAGAIAHVWRLVRKRCSKRPGFACERPKHEVYALTRTVTTRVAPSKGSRMALSLKVTNTPGRTDRRRRRDRGLGVQVHRGRSGRRSGLGRHH